MERLKTGVYQDIYNYNPVAFNKIVGAEEQEEEEEEEEGTSLFYSQSKSGS